MEESNRTAGPTAFISLLLEPIIRLCLRRGLSVTQFEEAARRTFVNVARQDLEESGTKANACKISVVTGLYWKEVSRVLKDPLPLEDEARGILPRIVSTWENDAKYRAKSGQPRVLTCDDEKSEFFALVRQVTSVFHPTSILPELLRTKSVQRTERGLKLVKGAVFLGNDDLRIFQWVSRDLDNMIRAGEENRQPLAGVGNLQHRTSYDNISQADIPTIKRWILNEGQAFHKRLRQFLSKFDHDISPPLSPKALGGARISVGTYSLAELPVEDESAQK